MEGPNHSQATHQKKKRKIDTSNPYSEIVYILVGTEQTKFAVHLAVLTKSSTFFDRILKEAQINIKPERTLGEDYNLRLSNGYYRIYLPTESADAFKYVNNWLYGNKIIETEENIADLTWNNIFNIYFFALRREMPALQNATIDASITKYIQRNTVPLSIQISRLYEDATKTTKLAAFRTLFVDMFTIRKGGIGDHLHLSEFNPQFLSAVIIALEKLRTAAVEEAKELKKKTPPPKKKGKAEKEEKHHPDSCSEDEGGNSLLKMRERYQVQVEPIEID